MVKARLIGGSIHQTKTAAGHFATGYRGTKFGRKGKPRGSVTVRPVGKYWGVFDSDPQPHVHYISLEEGKRLGKRMYG